MARPRAARIGSQRYRIAYDNTLLGAADNADGVCLPKNGLIGIQEELAPDRERETLLHEVLHAAWDQTHLREQDRDKEEAAIAALSPILFAFLRDNPKVLEYLLEKE